MTSTAAMAGTRPARARPRRPAGTLHRLAALTFTTGALLSCGVAAAWIASSQMLHESVQTLVRDSERSIELAGVETALSRYNRISNLIAANPDPGLIEQRRDSYDRIQGHLDAAARLSTSAAERADVASLRGEIRTYVDERRRLERSGVPIAEVIEDTRGVLGLPLSDIGRMRREYQRALRDSETRAAELTRRATMAGVIAIVFVFLSLGALMLGVRGWIIAPLGRIVRALDDLREKGPPARAPVEGPNEIRRIATVLNETTQSLADQRRQRLAFLAGVAHDLRNPLSGMRITIDVLRELDPSIEAHTQGGRALGVLDRNIERLTRMVDDLLDAARVEAGELALRFEEAHDLRDCARAAVELYRATTDKHDLRLIVPDEPVLVRADPGRMDQVVGNLVSNAIKYAPEGGEVVVRVERADGRAILAVRDHGVGISPEEQKVIFEPFRRARLGSGAAAGAGLGLSVVRRIVEAHGGHMEVESALGEGSEFRVVLPASAATRA